MAITNCDIELCNPSEMLTHIIRTTQPKIELTDRQGITCKFGNLSMYSYQNIVRSYINHSKENGLLVVHGLGSGKTLTAIFSAMNFPGNVIMLSPAGILYNLYESLEKVKTSTTNQEAILPPSARGYVAPDASVGPGGRKTKHKRKTKKQKNKKTKKYKGGMLETNTEPILHELFKLSKNSCKLRSVYKYDDTINDYPVNINDHNYYFFTYNGDLMNELTYRKFENLINAFQTGIINIPIARPRPLKRPYPLPPPDKLITIVDEPRINGFKQTTPLLIVIDEVHLLIRKIVNAKGRPSEYTQFYNFFVTGPGKKDSSNPNAIKTLFLSATPMVKDLQEFSVLMNLIAREDLHIKMTDYQDERIGKPGYTRVIYNYLTTSDIDRKAELASIGSITKLEEFSNKFSKYISYFGNITNIIPVTDTLPDPVGGIGYKHGYKSNGDLAYTIVECSMPSTQKTLIDNFNRLRIAFTNAKQLFDSINQIIPDYIFPIDVIENKTDQDNIHLSLFEYWEKEPHAYRYKIPEAMHILDTQQSYPFYCDTTSVSASVIHFHTYNKLLNAPIPETPYSQADMDSALSELSKTNNKFHTIIKFILEHPDKNHVVYSEFKRVNIPFIKELNKCGNYKEVDVDDLETFHLTMQSYEKEINQHHTTVYKSKNPNEIKEATKMLNSKVRIYANHTIEYIHLQYTFKERRKIESMNCPELYELFLVRERKINDAYNSFLEFRKQKPYHFGNRRKFNSATDQIEILTELICELELVYKQFILTAEIDPNYVMEDPSVLPFKIVATIPVALPPLPPDALPPLPPDALPPLPPDALPPLPPVALPPLPPDALPPLPPDALPPLPPGVPPVLPKNPYVKYGTSADLIKNLDEKTKISLDKWRNAKDKYIEIFQYFAKHCLEGTIFETVSRNVEKQKQATKMRTYKKYMFLTGQGEDSITADTDEDIFDFNHSDGQLTDNNKAMLIQYFNTHNHHHTPYDTNVIILNSASKEGVTLKNIDYIHILHVPSDFASLLQIIGRGIRNCVKDPPTSPVIPILYLTIDPSGTYNQDVIKYNKIINESDALIPLSNAIESIAFDCSVNSKNPGICIPSTSVK
jgi:hypothetical protein